MKKLIAIIASVVLFATAMDAQVVPGLKYSDLKDMYSTKDYVKSYMDPYSPAWSGVASFIIPGLGQTICGEFGRGLCFFGGNLACGIGTSVCFTNLAKLTETDSNGKVTMKDDPKVGTNILLIAGFCAAACAIDIWSIVDAVKVAKVKNMYSRDLYNHTSSLNLYPSVDYVPSSNGMQTTAGLSLALTF